VIYFNVDLGYNYNAQDQEDREKVSCQICIDYRGPSKTCQYCGQVHYRSRCEVLARRKQIYEDNKEEIRKRWEGI
jgi:hypothetical protein